MFNTINWHDTTHFDSKDDYVNNNSPIRDYIHPDENSSPTQNMFWLTGLTFDQNCQVISVIEGSVPRMHT